MLKPLLLALDFDETIASKDTDIVAQTLIPGDVPNEIKKLWSLETGCIPYMKRIFKLLQTHGLGQESIETVVREITPVPGLENLLKNLHSNNCEIIIISDANIIFIDKWLKHWSLRHTVEKIFSNPAWFDDSGLLNIENYHHQNWCKLSVENLCKGDVLDNYVKQREKDGVVFQKIGYVGDGSNDFCPMLRLSNRDLAFPRLDYPIMKKLKNNHDNFIMKAEIIPWTSGNDIWQEINSRIIFLN